MGIILSVKFKNIIKKSKSFFTVKALKRAPRREISLCFLPQWSVNQPPIGIAYLTAYLKKQNFKVHQRDLSIEMYSRLPEDKKYICESFYHENFLSYERFNTSVAKEVLPFIDEWAEELASSRSPFIGFTILSSNKIPTLIIIEKIKKMAPEKIIIVGGPHCTRYEGGFDLIENYPIDYLIPDEGEEVLYELLDALCAGKNNSEIKQIPGILFKNDEISSGDKETQIEVIKGISISKSNSVTDTGNRPMIKQINDLPIPVFYDFKLKSYKQLTLPILGSRGCIYKCAFCSETVLWKRYRFRTGKNLFEEFKTQFETTGSQSYYIVDSLINGNIKELILLCDHLIESGLKVYWGGKASIRKQMTKEVLEKMHQAGCRNLDYGIESGSPKILVDMKKGYEIPTATEVLRDSSNAGIQVGIFMMVGFPTEDEIDYNLSKKFLIDHKEWIHHVTPGYGFGIQPGSDTFINREKYGIIMKDDDWYSEHVTPEIRNFRVHDFRKFCVEIGLVIT